MKLYIFLFIIFLYLPEICHSQVTRQWSIYYNGSLNDSDVVNSMIVDSQGNVYVTGYSKGSGTGKDFATIKYNSEGILQWISRYNNEETNGDDISNAVAIDASGNIYVTGQSRGNGTFYDYVTIKYSPSGDFLWLSRYNGKGNDDDVSTAIAVDGLGNIYITGYSVGSNSSEDFVTIKYNSAGTTLWTSTYNDPDAYDIDIANSLLLDGSDNVYVSGYSIGVGTGYDYAIVKYSTSGNEIWNARYNGDGNGDDISTGMTLDPAGNIYITGYSIGMGSSEDFATVKFSSDGNQIWTRRFNGISNSYDIATGISADRSGNIYITGYSYNNESAEDYTTIKYNSNGDEIWIRYYNGTGNDYDITTSIKCDNSGNVYITGYSFEKFNDQNIVTLKYDTNGEIQWTEEFNGVADGDDFPSSLILDNAGNIYITGYSYVDSTNVDFITFKYSQTIGINQLSNSVPDGFILEQNYPNPFNPSTNIRYKISVNSFVMLKVYNVLGNEIASLVNEKQNPGTYSVSWNAGSNPSGTYFYKLQSDKFNQTKKMFLVK